MRTLVGVSRVLAALLIVFAGAAGFVVGWQADRLFGDRADTPRPDALQAAWRAYDADDLGMLSRALVVVRDTPMPTADFAAEADVLDAIATDDHARVSEAADRHAGRPAGAVALARIIDRARSAPERLSAVNRLRERYPDSWVLATLRPEPPK